MKDKLPNIIFIITDQQRYDTINKNGFNNCVTPNLDKLIDNGTNLSNCFVAGASCAPSRAALFTGYFPHTTGILSNGVTWRKTWINKLKEKGYETVNIGKMHTEPMNTHAGFTERYNVENKQRVRNDLGVNKEYLDEWDKFLGINGIFRPNKSDGSNFPNFKDCLGAFDWDLDEKYHPDIFVGNLAKWWIKRREINKPLFLQIGFPGPHPPYDPTMNFLNRLKNKKFDYLETYEKEIKNQPTALKNLRNLHQKEGPDSTFLKLDANKNLRQAQLHHYHANITLIDNEIGQIISCLEQKNLLDDSLIIFTSDHGDCLLEHGLSQKWSGYDQVMRVPMIISNHNKYKKIKNIDNIIQQQDIISLIFDIANVEIDKTYEVNDLVPLFKELNYKDREFVFCENGKERHMSDSLMTVARNKDWKLVKFQDEENGQLFDLHNDPLEIDNLWFDRNTQKIKSEILDYIFDWRIESQLKTNDLIEEVR
tara:strand:+ start:998 stop:2437 length:1440 start_codon:yes stop_codon:yes gene_type:complete